MPRTSTLELARENLFSTVEEMTANGLGQQMQNRLIRLRDMYNQWLNYPSMKDKEIVERIIKTYDVARSTAYEDVKMIKYLLGDLNKCSKDYHRYKFIKRNEATYELARRRNDTRAMAACDNYYAKYMQLDKEDAKDLGYDKIIIQPFTPTADPSILGVKPVPNIREKIRAKIKQYWNDDVEEVRIEEGDFNEDAIFTPPHPEGEGGEQ